MCDKSLQVGVVGCGNIAGPYLANLVSYPEIDVRGVADLDLAHAEALATRFGCRAYPTVDALLADPEIELIVNLTIHHAHEPVIARCLNAGKHVFSEKPLALTYHGAQCLVNMAKERGLRLGCAPVTYMGEAQQTAWRLIREDWLGTVRIAYAEVNWGRIETWHPSPAPFYDVGVMFDVAVYPLTLLTAMFGPARRIYSYGKVIHPERTSLSGEVFRVTSPDFIVSTIELANGLLVRLTANFYVSLHSKQSGLELHGDIGSLFLSSWHDFDASVQFAMYDGEYESVPLLKEPYTGERKVEWGRPILDMAKAIRGGYPHRASAEHAAHVVEIVCASIDSMELGHPVEIRSSFSPPRPMDWALS